MHEHNHPLKIAIHSIMSWLSWYINYSCLTPCQGRILSRCISLLQSHLCGVLLHGTMRNNVEELYPSFLEVPYISVSIKKQDTSMIQRRSHSAFILTYKCADLLCTALPISEFQMFCMRSTHEYSICGKFIFPNQWTYSNAWDHNIATISTMTAQMANTAVYIRTIYHVAVALVLPSPNTQKYTKLDKKL